VKQAAAPTSTRSKSMKISSSATCFAGGRGSVRTELTETDGEERRAWMAARVMDRVEGAVALTLSPVYCLH